MTKAVVACLIRVALRACLASGGTVLPGHLAVAEPSCADTAGRAQAHRYVQRCLEVSPATHPPCNAANPCSLIRDEIRRGCALLGTAAPAFCRTGRQPE